MTPDGIDRIKLDEGLRLKPYKDTAIPPKLTIGFGLNLDAGITKEEAEWLLLNRLSKLESTLEHHIIWSSLNNARRDVLLNMAYNLGLDGLYKFNRFFQRLSMRDYQRAADEMLDSVWSAQVGERAHRLADIMRMGVYK